LILELSKQVNEELKRIKSRKSNIKSPQDPNDEHSKVVVFIDTLTKFFVFLSKNINPEHALYEECKLFYIVYEHLHAIVENAGSLGLEGISGEWTMNECDKKVVHVLWQMMLQSAGNKGSFVIV
jgi:hypothetical protein